MPLTVKNLLPIWLTKKHTTLFSTIYYSVILMLDNSLNVWNMYTKLQTIEFNLMTLTVLLVLQNFENIMSWIYKKHMNLFQKHTNLLQKQIHFFCLNKYCSATKGMHQLHLIFIKNHAAAKETSHSSVRVRHTNTTILHQMEIIEEVLCFKD